MPDCIFCKIIEGKIPAKKVMETDSVIAVEDISPQAPVHVLVLPKKHVNSLNELSQEERREILPTLYDVADELTKAIGLRDRGYRCVINNQAEAGQSVFHLHMHVLAGGKLKGRFGS